MSGLDGPTIQEMCKSGLGGPTIQEMCKSGLGGPTIQEMWLCQGDNQEYQQNGGYGSTHEQLE